MRRTARAWRLWLGPPIAWTSFENWWFGRWMPSPPIILIVFLSSTAGSIPNFSLPTSPVLLTPSLIDRLQEEAAKNGFDHFAVTPAQIPSLDQAAYRSWVEQGLGSGLAYMTRDPDKRLHMDQAFPGMISVLTLGVSYYQGPI